MNLEETLQQKRGVVERYPSEKVLEQVERGNKFIVVDEDISLSQIPGGYTLIDMKYKGDSFKTLVPQSLLFYMANPGEGDAVDALDELADFYGDAEDFEDEMIENGQTNVQEANWATLARGSYKTYLINRLVKHKSLERDSEGEPVPEFNQKTLRQLNMGDPYISERAKAIAAVALEKTVDEVKGYGVGRILKHITVQGQGETKKLTKQELEQVRCYAGSHWELKSEYRNKDDVKYKINGRDGEGTKTSKSKEIPVFDAKINKLESEIAEYRKEGHREGRHDAALLRQYVNLAFIAPENPQAQLDITPPDEIKGEEK